MWSHLFFFFFSLLYFPLSFNFSLLPNNCWNTECVSNFIFMCHIYARIPLFIIDSFCSIFLLRKCSVCVCVHCEFTSSPGCGTKVEYHKGNKYRSEKFGWPKGKRIRVYQPLKCEISERTATKQYPNRQENIPFDLMQNNFPCYWFEIYKCICERWSQTIRRFFRLLLCERARAREKSGWG